MTVHRDPFRLCQVSERPRPRRLSKTVVCTTCSSWSEALPHFGAGMAHDPASEATSQHCVAAASCESAGTVRTRVACLRTGPLATAAASSAWVACGRTGRPFCTGITTKCSCVTPRSEPHAAALLTASRSCRRSLRRLHSGPSNVSLAAALEPTCATTAPARPPRLPSAEGGGRRLLSHRAQPPFCGKRKLAVATCDAKA